MSSTRPPSFPVTRPVGGASGPGVEGRGPRGTAPVGVVGRVPGAWSRTLRRLRPWSGPRRPRRGSEWLTGAFAGVQGAVMSLVVVVVPAMAAYVATSADPTNAQISWPRSAGVGAAVWLLGQGGELVAGGARVGIVPLGVTALVLFACYASARRSARPSVPAWGAGIAGHLAVVAVALVAVGSSGPIGAGAGAVVRTVLGAAAVAALGLGLGMARDGAPGAWLAPRIAGVPGWLRVAVRVGLGIPAMLVAAASAVVLTWVLAGQAATGDVIEALGTDAFGGSMLAVAQLALAPNLVVWAVSWLTGTGFAVGAGTMFAPDHVLGGPMPALPLLGVLPTQAGGLLAWAPLVVVLVGALAALRLHRGLQAQAPWEPLAAVVAAAVVAGVVTGVLAALSGGPAGPGRMTVVGPASLRVALDTVALVMAGLVWVVPGSSLVREAVRRALRRGRQEDPAG